MALTANEEQELKYLEVFVSNKISKFDSIAYPDKIVEAMGNGAYAIIKNFMRDGVVEDLFTGEYEFTIVGQNRYRILRKKKVMEYIMSFAFWVIFVCTLIAAGDVIYKWSTRSLPISEPIKSANQEPAQKINNPAQIIAPDSIRGRCTDSLKIKK
jgi:hypothetical protein